MKPTIILNLILTAISMTSSNAAELNQLALKLSAISPGFTSTAIPPEDIHGDIQLLTNGPDGVPSAYFDDCGVLIQAVECRL
jgi:hypothetical protein